MTEPLTGARRPSDADAPLGGTQISRAIDDLAPFTVPRFDTSAQRDAAYSAFVAGGGTMRDGMRCAVGSVQYARAGGTWQVMWTPPATASGWVALPINSTPGPGTNGIPQFRRIDNQVVFRGSFNGNNLSPSSVKTVATVPAGLRPPTPIYVPISTNSANAPSRVIVLPTGEFQIGTSDSLVSMQSIDAVRYYLD